MSAKYLARPIISAIIISAGFVFGQFILAMVNPATAYCRGLGYDWQVKQTAAGEIGICKLPDNSTCEEWDFLTGKCGIIHSYCARKDYQLKTITDGKKCSSAFSRECAVCLLEDGTEEEVLALMIKNKEIPPPTEEGILTPPAGARCGDGVCGASENSQNCPADCPIPSPAPAEEKLPPTAIKGLALYLGFGFLILVAIIGLVYYFQRKRKTL